MNLLIDGCVYERAGQRGIQRYYYELLSRLSNEAVGRIYFRKQPVGSIPRGLELKEISEQYRANSRGIAGRAFAKSRRLWFPTSIPKGDVFHSTYFTRSPHKGLPEVVTVHDMVPEMMPYSFEGDVDQEIATKRECIFAARKIIAISHATASDLATVYPDVAKRIHVIHSGAQHLSVVTEDDIRARVYSDNSYVVFIGDRRGYKNFRTLLDAVASHDWPDQLKLVVIGTKFSDGEVLAIRVRGLSGLVESIVHPTDEDMRSLLIKANGFIFPSLMEGFGFPLVEAQALGVPVIASDIGVFREIGGEAFLRVAPLEPRSIAKGVREALNPDTRLRLAISGIENVGRFSWVKCARQTCEVWKQAFEGL